MSVETTLNRKSYAGDGVTTAFPTTFQFLSASDLVAILKDNVTGVETTQTLNTHYTVSGGSGSTGTVTMLVAPAAGKTLTLINDPATTQSLDLIEGDVSPAEAKEQAYDRLTFICQRLKDRLDRAVVLTDGTVGITPTLPQVLTRGALLYLNSTASGILAGPGTAADRAGKYLAWDANGDPMVAVAPSSIAPTAFVATLFDDVDASTFLSTLGVSAFIKTLLDDANAGAALTTLGVSTFIKTLLDDADAGAALTTLGVSAFVQTLLDDASASAALTTLGVSTFIKTLLDDTDAATAKTTLGLVFDSQVLCNTGNGHGSTNTAIRRYINAITTGTDITYADSAANGASLTINTAGLYAMAMNDSNSGGTCLFGFSLNSNQLTTSISLITTANRILLANTAGSGNFGSVSAVVRCAANDVIRPHTNLSPNDVSAASQFRIVRIG
jgi:hypothetical protein